MKQVLMITFLISIVAVMPPAALQKNHSKFHKNQQPVANSYIVVLEDYG